MPVLALERGPTPELPVCPAAHLSPDTPEGVEVDATTLSVHVIKTDPVDTAIMMATETPGIYCKYFNMVDRKYI